MSSEHAEKHRVGLLGGTFDPIHNAHLKMAECARTQLDLDEVRFLPAGTPPHKQSRPDGASDADRLEMVRLAISGHPGFVLDDEEMRREGPSYTYKTLEALCEREADSRFYFIIGADMLMDFDSWRHPELICRSCVLVCAGRNQLDTARLRQKAEELKERFLAEIVLLDFPQMQIASSELRRRIRQGDSIRDFVPAGVWNYIVEKKLYLGKTQTDGACI